MNKSFRLVVSSIALVFAGTCSISNALATPIVDGTKDLDYGAALAVQTVETQFGDNQSELNAGYASIESGQLFLMLTGNIEANFNSIEIFIDSKFGGQSVFSSAGNDLSENMDDLVFDTGFTADYHLIVRRGFFGTNTFILDFANLNTGTFESYSDLFGGASEGIGQTGVSANAANNSSQIGVAYDGSNLAGVLGGVGAADQTAAEAVTTGLELSISLEDLGATGDINVMVGVNNADHNFWSNQFLGGLAPNQGNLGGDGFGNFTGSGNIDMNAYAGNQFFTVTAAQTGPNPIPEPASMALLSLGLVWLRLMSRKKT